MINKNAVSVEIRYPVM